MGKPYFRDPFRTSFSERKLAQKVDVDEMADTIEELQRKDRLPQAALPEAEVIVKLRQQVKQLEAKVDSLTIVEQQVIPWEPGMLGFSYKYRNGQQGAVPISYLPHVKTRYTVKLEEQLSAALLWIKNLESRRLSPVDASPTFLTPDQCLEAIKQEKQT